MKSIIRQRIIQIIPILLGITVISFVMMQLTTADAVDRMYQMQEAAVSETVKASQRQALSLDQPIVIQYFLWMKELLRGNLGTSFVTNEPVAAIFMDKLPITLKLCFFAMTLTLVVSIPIGIFAAIYKNELPDYLIRVFSFIGNSMPNFFVAVLLIYFFSLKLGWFPVINVLTKNQNIILPGVTLAISMSAKYIKQIRIFVLDELSKDYITGAISRGVSLRSILSGSVLKSLLFSLLSLVSVSLGSLLGGTTVVETIFMLDGVGKMAIDAIRMSDLPIIQAYVIWMTVIFVGLNLTVDILYHYLNPYIRYTGREV